MIQRRDMHDGNSDDWSADHPAVAVERSAEPPGQAGAVMLHHPSHPLSAVVMRSVDTLRALANLYLERVQTVAGISDELLRALRADDRPDFGWLPVSWGPGELGQARDPTGSFWVAREHDGEVFDRTLVLLAGYRLDLRRSAGSSSGLRVMLHLRDVPLGRWRVRITGMGTSRLPTTFADKPPLSPATLRVQARIGALAQTLGYPFYSIDGVDYADLSKDQTLRVSMSCGRPSGGTGALRNFRLLVELPADALADAKVLAQHERCSHATAPVFAHDPASRAPPAPVEKRLPTRKAAVLDPLRTDTARLQANLDHPSGARQVRQTRLGQVKADPDAVQQITLAQLPLRSDDLAAAHAYLRGDDLLRRFESYGLSAQSFFKRAQLPLLLRHRAPLKGARDGVSINAQVRPSGIGRGVLPGNVSGPAQRPQIEVSFGWATLAHRSRKANGAGRRREQPLGLAADPRWAWHEFGHVLNFASFGELEFPFAHSAGDALAAIVADPDSACAAELRGLTFPWVFTPRRHNRNALTGWCWCGRRNRSRLAQASAGAPPAGWLGYFEEQLLSSSLFRLYRCIGGADMHPATRRSASDYCVYLLMRAIQLLGGSPAPARQVGQLVHALVDADIGTAAWNIDASWPEADAPRAVKRIGGCVHKVIRWAFERQGLYATGDDSTTVEGPGRPPEVDVYIADCRLGAPGGYEPVSLNAAGGATPDWHAGNDGVGLEQGQLVVKVRNRGRSPAPAVQVRCWVLSPPGPDPDDPAANWVELPGIGGARTVADEASVPFSFIPLVSNQPLAGDHFVKAAATCDADRSNLDAAAMLAPAFLVAPIADLVANDNNLALRMLRF
jgi:hypothetical protein